jgi:hypothetical protein
LAQPIDGGHQWHVILDNLNTHMPKQDRCEAPALPRHVNSGGRPSRKRIEGAVGRLIPYRTGKLSRRGGGSGKQRFQTERDIVHVCGEH